MDEIFVLTETGEIDASVYEYYQTPVQSTEQRGSRLNTRGRFVLGTGENVQRRGRRPFIRNTGENDPCDMSIALMNIHENQVRRIGIHNLSKSLRPNLANIRVLSLGTKFIPKWKFEKRKNAFQYFNDFFRRMNNKVYFTET